MRGLQMDDNTLKDLVSKHDTSIEHMVTSIDSLVTSQNELNKNQFALTKELGNIAQKLTNQDLVNNRIDLLDKELAESFKRRDDVLNESNKRIHKRIDTIANIQTSDNGCNSVRLLTKDVQALTKDTIRLVGVTEEHRIKIEHIDESRARDVSPTSIKWGIAIMLTYTITFGTYIVDSINKLNATDIKTLSMLGRDMKDTNKLMGLVYKPGHYK